MTHKISPSQLRAARGLLGWTRAQLADFSGVSEPTIQRIESNLMQARTTTVERLIQAFTEHDLEFVADDGVKRKSDRVVKLEGFEDFKFFMDQVYEAAKQPHSLDGTKPICICNLDNSLFRKHMKDYHAVHVERLKKVDGLKIKSIASEVDKNHVQGASYLTYRYLKELKAVVAPFYVFGDKFALIDFDVPEPPTILMIHSPALARSYRDQFKIMWKNASDKPPT